MKIIDITDGEWAIKPDSADEIISSERFIQAFLIGDMEIEEAEKAATAMFAGFLYLTRFSDRAGTIPTLMKVA